jgi:hypothetical protein
MSEPLEECFVKPAGDSQREGRSAVQSVTPMSTRKRRSEITDEEWNRYEWLDAIEFGDREKMYMRHRPKTVANDLVLADVDGEYRWVKRPQPIVM